MIVGATPRMIIRDDVASPGIVPELGLKRVFYSAYIPVNEDSCLPSLPGGPPFRVAYQADWLRVYGFRVEEPVGGQAEFQRILILR